MARFLQSNTNSFIACYFAIIFALTYQALVAIVLFFLPRGFCFKRKNIRGQKILITGAGSGLGRQLAVEFSKHATCLMLVDIDEQSLLLTKKLLDEQSTVFIYECDVSDYMKVSKMAQRVERDAGDVDILVNNAGIVSGEYLNELSRDQIRRTMEVNVLAHFWTAKVFLPAMIKRNSGHVVTIASMAGKVGCPRITDYCSSKFAAIGFAESLEVELREQKLDGIKITVVCPSFINTGLFSGIHIGLGTLMTTEYVAKEVILGVLEEQEVIYLPAFTKFIPILKECLPRWSILKFEEITGIIKMMVNYTGRPMNEASQPEDVCPNNLTS